MKFSIYYLTLFVLLFSSCTEKKEPKIINKNYDEVPQYVKMNNNKKLTDSLFNLAISKGDEKAYNIVSGNYILEENYNGLLYYSLLMANKHNCSEAHFHIYLILSGSESGESIEKLDNRTKNLALYHLIKSNELGYESAKYSINEVLGKGNVIKDSKYYLNEYSK